jgi:hypothetical protein
VSGIEADIDGIDGRFISPSPSLHYLREEYRGRYPHLLSLLGPWIRIQDREDALGKAALKALVRAERYGIETDDHDLAHENPDSWMIRTSQRDLRTGWRGENREARRRRRRSEDTSWGSSQVISVDAKREVWSRRYPEAWALCARKMPRAVELLELMNGDFEAVLGGLASHWRILIDLCRADRIEGPDIHFTGQQIGEMMFRDREPDARSEALGVKALRRREAGRKCLLKALLSEPPGPTPETPLTVLAWERVSSLPDPDQRRALALYMFGRLAAELDAEPDSAVERLEGREFAMWADRELEAKLRGIAIGAARYGMQARAPVDVASRMEVLRAKALARIRQFLLREGFDDLEDISPRL